MHRMCDAVFADKTGKRDSARHYGEIKRARFLHGVFACGGQIEIVLRSWQNAIGVATVRGRELNAKER